MFLGIKVLLRPTIHFFFSQPFIFIWQWEVFMCVLKWHIWSFLWLKENHLLSSVSPQSHSSNASALGEQLSSIGWVTLGKVTFTQILHFRFWRCCIKRHGVCPPSCHWHAPGDVLELCIHALFTWSIVERLLPCWVKKGVCLLNRWAPGLESVCMWDEGSVWLCYVHLWAPGILETHEIFSSISVVALIVFCKKRNPQAYPGRQEQHPRFNSEWVHFSAEQSLF